MLRFSLSTTKDIDIGDLQVALLSYIISKKTDQNLLISIDDTDKKNHIENKDKEILEILNLFSIEYSQVVQQSENIKYHTQMAMKLLLDKKAFNCFCSDEVLEDEKEKAKKEQIPYVYSGFCETISDETKFNCNAPFVVRLKHLQNETKLHDLLKGDIISSPSSIDRFLILHQDKSPTSDFSSAVNDMLFNITTIVTQEDKLKNNIQQINVREALGYTQQINYLHIPNLKIDTILNVKSLIDEGYLPVAITNYLLSLCYNTNEEFFTLEEILETFNINNISTTNKKFEIEKLKLYNRHYLQTIEDMRLSKILGYADDDIGKLAKIYLKECNTTKEIKEKIDTIFSVKNKNLKGFEQELSFIQTSLQESPYFEDFDMLLNYLVEKTALKDEKLLTPLRFLLTNTTSGPDLDKIYPLIKNYLGEITK